MINPTNITNVKFLLGSIRLHNASDINIINCIKIIQLRLCPNFFVNIGILILSINGAQR